MDQPATAVFKPGGTGARARRQALRPIPADQSGPAGANPSLLPMLSVMVLTLAFFVVLNSISRVEEDRSKRVLSSVGQTFGAIAGSSLPATSEGVAATDGARILQQIFQPMENLATDQVRVRRVLADSLEFRFATAWMFPGTSVELGPTAANFIAEIRRLLDLRPAQWGYEMEMALTAPDAGDVEFSRAASLAAGLAGDDAPDRVSAVSVTPGPDREIVIRIDLRPPSSPDEFGAGQP